MEMVGEKWTEKKLSRCFAYLDMLRESGVTNMYAAAPYVMRDCRLKRDMAVSALSLWIKTFSTDEPRVRARAAITRATTP